MHRLRQVKFGTVAGYLWISFLVFVVLISARTAYRQTLRTEEYPHSCDPFGYLEMAKEIRLSAPRFEFPTFKIESPQTRLLINLMESKNLPRPVWNNLVGPHAYHYFPKADHVGVQYPPGTGLTLAFFPEKKAVYQLNLVVVSTLLAVAVIALVLAALRRAWAAAGLIVLAIYVAYEILGRLGSLSFSINVVMVPLLLACLLSLAALWLRNGLSRQRVAWLAAFGVGLCLGYALLVRLPSVFFVPGFLLLLWPSGGWRAVIKGAPVALCLGLFLGGFVPLFVHQQLTAGAWYVSTYSPSVQTNLPTIAILRHNFNYYFGTGYQTEDNWSLIYLVLGFVGWILYSYLLGSQGRSQRLGIGWKRLAVSAVMVWALPTAFFLSQTLTGLHYMMAQNFCALVLVSLGALAIESSSTTEAASDRVRWQFALAGLALVLASVPAFVSFQRAWKDRDAAPPTAGPVAHASVTIPAELADEHAWVWADLLTGTLWYYDHKPAFRVRFSNKEVRAMVYRYVEARGEPQYVIRDSEFIDEIMEEITRMGGSLEPRGQVDGQPYFLIHWQNGGPKIASGNEATLTTKS